MLPAQPKNAMSPSRTPLTKRARPWRVRPHDRPSSADGLGIVLRAIAECTLARWASLDDGQPSSFRACLIWSRY